MTRDERGESAFGCLGLVLAVFLAVVLWNVTPELIAWLETELGG